MITHSRFWSFSKFNFQFFSQIKEFLKRCKVANFAKQMKQILDRVKEASNCIVERRKKATLDLRDSKAVVSTNDRNFTVSKNPELKFLAALSNVARIIERSVEVLSLRKSN